MVHGVTLRAIGAFSDADLEFRPTAIVRTPRELIFHIYSQEKILAEAARVGRFDAEAARRSSPEDALARDELASLTTTSALKEYADACHQSAMGIFRAMSDEALARRVIVRRVSGVRVPSVCVRRTLASSRPALHVSASSWEGAAQSIRLRPQRLRRHVGDQPSIARRPGRIQASRCARPRRSCRAATCVLSGPGVGARRSG